MTALLWIVGSLGYIVLGLVFIGASREFWKEDERPPAGKLDGVDFWIGAWWPLLLVFGLLVFLLETGMRPIARAAVAVIRGSTRYTTRARARWRDRGRLPRATASRRRDAQ